MPYQHVFEGKRLHPATIIVQVGRFLKSIALLLVIAIVARVYGRSADMVEIVATFLGGLSIAGAVLKYVSYRYSIRDGALHITSGIIQRQHRTIPLERIQNINVKQELLHRLLGVADVHVETASGGDAEASLSVVSLAEAAALRVALSQQRVAMAETAEAPPEVVYRATIGQLVLAGATQNRLGTLLAGLVGLAFYINSFVSDESWRFGNWIERVSRSVEAPTWLGIVMIALGLLAVGWITSIVLTLYGRFGFELTRAHGQLQRSYGLLTRHQSIFPVERVQVLRVISPFFQRWIGLCRIAAETAGSFREGERQDQGSNELCPIIQHRMADAMCRLVIDEFSLDAVAFTSIHPLGRRRAFVRAFVMLAILVGGLSWFTSPLALWALIGVPLIAGAYAWLYFRSIGYALAGKYLVIRQGIWTRTVEVVPVVKVQASFVRESPLQRRLGLASFEVLTAGSAFGRTVSVHDLGLSTATSLQDRVIAEAEAH